MRIQKIALMGTLFLIIVCIALYSFLDITLPSESHSITSMKREQHDQQDWNNIIAPLIVKNNFSNNQIKELPYDEHKKSITNVFVDTSCNAALSQNSPSKVDIQMLSLYTDLKFDNLDGGVWKQGWNIVYNAGQWDNVNKLKVFVVPHSHNDPGWKVTFEDYYQSQTRSILNNMVNKLMEDTRRKFIWAEISYFSLWWQEINDGLKQKVKLLLERNQLEIVTGGWVMNDEANAHYYSILQQLTHGHQWLRTNLNITPRFGWAIDPFGYSPTQPYFLKKMGLEALVIQRTHYSVKKALARNKQLEFRWRQLWDTTGNTDFFSHMMPFYSYDIPHTCGPDPKICCQFDFKRLPGYGVTCPWRVPPQSITDGNIAHRAEMILDQWRKKAQLYSTNVVMVPLGDDFRYDHATEWDAQYNNYQKLFDYINNNPALSVEAKFGTLSDYFEAVKAERPADQFPSLSGDFFTYADRDDHYWSGYYTSRPLYKRMDRELQAYLRSADMIFTLAWLESMKVLNSEWLTSSNDLMKRIFNARSSLSLFQHHDGITGTAKDHVVQDYAYKLLAAIRDCQHIIQQSAHFLLTPSKETYTLKADVQYFNLDDTRKLAFSLPEQNLLTFTSGYESRKVVFYNSLTRHRQEIVFLKVSIPEVQVKDWKGRNIPCEVSPLCQLTDAYSHCYQLTFIVDVEPLGLSTYIVEKTSANDPNRAKKVQIKVLNSGWTHNVREMFEDWVKEFDSEKEFTLQNNRISAAFSTTGLLKAVSLKESGTTIPLHLGFVKYNARQGKERSGAYLFLPDGEAETLRFQLPLILVFEGEIFSKVVVNLPYVVHSVLLCNSPGGDGFGLEIHNLVNISSINSNYELAMRVSSNVDNGDTFFTDLNGLQMIKRKRFKKLPLQANFYPVTSSIFIEDALTRLTLLSAQPLGATSLKGGQIEIMQDRRLLQDDNRGLDQGVMDNKQTLTIFRLLVEQRNENCDDEGYLSEESHIALTSLNHPMHHLLWTKNDQTELSPTYSPVKTPQPLDFHIVSLSTLTLPEISAGLVVHRTQLDKCFSTSKDHPTSGQITINSFLPSKLMDKIIPSSLSFLQTGKSQRISNMQSICPMDILAFLIPKNSH
uniref:Alpha-mannosidase n=1 Tax=Clastoptera arizonana TaxID=38151 RepID=A0A1B6CBG0_9HEMI